MRVIDEYGPDRIVLGLPYNMDGTEGPRAKLVRDFAAALERAITAALGPHTRLRIAFHDERLSSFAAEQKLNRTGRTHAEKKALRDALAACAILEDFLAVQRGDRRTGPTADESGDADDDGIPDGKAPGA
jgi:putative Holliday junction resolvase